MVLICILFPFKCCFISRFLSVRIINFTRDLFSPWITASGTVRPRGTYWSVPVVASKDETQTFETRTARTKVTPAFCQRLIEL